MRMIVLVQNFCIMISSRDFAQSFFLPIIWRAFGQDKALFIRIQRHLWMIVLYIAINSSYPQSMTTVEGEDGGTLLLVLLLVMSLVFVMSLSVMES